MKIEEILEDKFRETLKEKYTSCFSNKTILLTGAAGSIGRNLALLLLQTSLESLILVDHSEANLYELEQSLILRGYNNFSIQLLDVTCELSVQNVFLKYKPDLVYHAAAYKQVPLLEKFPKQAFKVNTIGTKNMVDNAIKFKTRDFIFISTDKAVHPKSVMGVSKRMAEIYLTQFLERTDTIIKVIRFGNIPGTQGSVLPSWEKQLKLTSKIKVVNKAMERYFVSLNQVCLMLMDVVSVKTYSLLISEMGNHLSIKDLAVSFLERRKLKEDHIVYTDIRPGEKKSESLSYPNEKIIIHKKDFFSKGMLVYNKTSSEALNTLIEKYESLDDVSVKKTFSNIVKEF